ncbi:MAG TPA: 2OG-Fe(II) oxygenase [Candidatus Acidoferrales bacterium]|nr:2OG-Fe(II) oxygenase [Candidatus Acidoferrales bacterium]
MGTVPMAADMRLFPYSRWRKQLPRLAERYQAACPFPHIHLTNFLEGEAARSLAEQFPRPSSEAWIQYKHFNENKSGLTRRDLFPQGLQKLVDELNSEEFLSWLCHLTGIPKLVADPTLEGGGLHQSSRGGFLNLHTDFTMHPRQKEWRRRINLILYLNPEWREEWGGAIELWDAQMRKCCASVPPLLNHAVIFSTVDDSYHGFPEKLRCPEGVSRKSLALYYYTVERDANFARQSTDYHARPTDGKAKAALIWLDKQAVRFYSRAKERFGISDKAASKILGFLSKKK